MEISVDNAIGCLIDAYIARSDRGILIALNRLDDIGVDKYTAFEISMNKLHDYLEKYYVRKRDE